MFDHIHMYIHTYIHTYKHLITFTTVEHKARIWDADACSYCSTESIDNKWLCFRFSVSGYGCDICFKNLSRLSDEVQASAHKACVLQLLLVLITYTAWMRRRARCYRCSVVFVCMSVCLLITTVRYDTIWDAILTCARKLAWVSLIYRMEA